MRGAREELALAVSFVILLIACKEKVERNRGWSVKGMDDRGAFQVSCFFSCSRNLYLCGASLRVYQSDLPSCRALATAASPLLAARRGFRPWPDVLVFHLREEESKRTKVNIRKEKGHQQTLLSSMQTYMDATI